MDDECFICLEEGDPRIRLRMTECGCSPMVHSECLLEWYTGKGANGRDICPVCRTSGCIQGIGSIIEQTADSGGSYQALPDTAPAYPPHITIPVAPLDDTSSRAVEDENRANQRRQQHGAAVCILIALVILFVCMFLRLEDDWDSN